MVSPNLGGSIGSIGAGQQQEEGASPVLTRSATIA